MLLNLHFVVGLYRSCWTIWTSKVVLDLFPLFCGGVNLVDRDVFCLVFSLRLLCLPSVHEATDGNHDDKNENNDNYDDNVGV